MSDSEDSDESLEDVLMKCIFKKSCEYNIADFEDDFLAKIYKYAILSNQQGTLGDENTIKNEFKKLLQKLNFILDGDIIVSADANKKRYVQRIQRPDNGYYSLTYISFDRIIPGDDFNSYFYANELSAMDGTDLILFSNGFYNSWMQDFTIDEMKYCAEFFTNIYKSLSPCQKLLQEAELKLPIPVKMTLRDLPKDAITRILLQFDKDYYSLNDIYKQAYEKSSLENLFRSSNMDPQTRDLITKIDKIRFVNLPSVPRFISPFQTLSGLKRKRSLG